MESRASTISSQGAPIITYRSDDRVAIITLLWTTSDGKSATSSYSSRRDDTYLENHSIGDLSGGGPITRDRLGEIETELSLPLARTLESRRPEVEALFRNLGIPAVHLPVRSCPGSCFSVSSESSSHRIVSEGCCGMGDCDAQTCR